MPNILLILTNSTRKPQTTGLMGWLTPNYCCKLKAQSRRLDPDTLCPHLHVRVWKKKPCSFSLTGLMPVSHSPIWLLEVLLHTSCLSKEKRKHWMKAASSVNLALVHTCQFLHCLLAVCTPVGFKSLKHYLAQTTYQHMPIQGSIYMKLHIGWQFSFKLCLLNLQS